MGSMRIRKRTVIRRDNKLRMAGYNKQNEEAGWGSGGGVYDGAAI